MYSMSFLFIFFFLTSFVNEHWKDREGGKWKNSGDAGWFSACPRKERVENIAILLGHSSAGPGLIRIVHSLPRKRPFDDYARHSKACPEEVVTEQVPGVAGKAHHDSGVPCSALRGCSSHVGSCFCCPGSGTPNL